jgi:O-antigen ligase
MGISRLIGVDESGADPNALAATINYSLPFAYVLYQRAKDILQQRWWSKLLIGYLVLSAFCIFLTGSRAGAISIVVCTFFIWLRMQHKFRWLFIFIILAIISWNILPYEKKIRLETIWNPDIVMEGIEGEKFMESAKISAQGRSEGFWDGVHLFLKSPILGFGAGNFIIARQQIRKIPLELQPHNLYGQLLGELGGLGVIAFCFLIYKIISLNLSVLRAKVPHLSPIAWASLTVILLLLLNGFAGHNLYRYNWLWIAAFSSILFRLIQNRRSEQNQLAPSS